VKRCAARFDLRGRPALTAVNTDIDQRVTSTPWRLENLDRMAERIGKLWR